MGQTKRLAILTAAASLMMATGATPLAGAQATPDPSPTTTTTTNSNSNSNSTDTMTTDPSQDDTTAAPVPGSPMPDDTSTGSPDDSTGSPDEATDDTTTTPPPGDDATVPDDSMSHGSPGDDDATAHDSPSGDGSTSHDAPSDDHATDGSSSNGSGDSTSASGTQADADFVAYIAGSGEVPQTSSTAWAWSEFVVSDDGSELQWSARVFGLDNAVAAHLHLAPKGVNGPIVVPLAPPEEGSGPNDSADISGTITDEDLAGPLAGMTVGDLVDEIEAGNIYLNIHTSDGQDGASKVPGDYPDGEIRGQLVSWPPES